MAHQSRRSVGGGERRKYTTRERREALADVGKLGLHAAASKHGMPATTVANWVSRGLPKRSEKGSKVGASKVRASKTEVKKLDTVVPKGLRGRSTAEKANAVTAANVSTPSPARASRSQPSTPAVTVPAPAARRARPAKKYTLSQRAEIVEYATKHDVTAASKKFKVSRFSIYDWLRKVKIAATGAGDSPTSGPEPLAIEKKRDEEILAEWRSHPGLGPSQIRNQLRRKSIKVSVHTTRRVMEDAGYRPRKVKREPHDKRFEAIRPNHLWHLDFVQRFINRASVFTLIIIDDYSRFVVGHGVVVDAERADTVLEAFIEATRRHGRPESVMSDKGSAFWSWRGISRFTNLLTEMGIDQLIAEQKEWNGKVEVFNGNLHKELFDAHRFADVSEMQRRLAGHLRWYNHERTHHALGGLLVPADRFFGRAEEVLARIESGAGRDLSDLVDLRARTLDLFKIATQEGATEIWLMGKKIFELPKV